MFVVDSILLSPVKGFMWIVRELHKAAQQELKGESDQLTHRLSTLYMMLETGQVTQEEFERQEHEILTRLEALDAAADAQAAEDDETDDENGDDAGDDTASNSDDDEISDADAADREVVAGRDTPGGTQ
jgi:hypothetical protein